ncbi:MAG: histidine--tRNA ligase [Beijerinckiaceae bacterium]
MSQSNSTPKAKLTEARRPRGLEDRGPADIAAQRQMLETIRAVYERYGFEAVETPFFEYTDALGKFLPDQDRPNAGVFSLQDDDEQWMSLRYDLTAPLARYVAENFDKLPKPYRSYRVGPVFRNEKPGPGRFRQFMQFDADTVGASSVAADAENCMMFADAMEALGIPRGSYVVKVNNRKVLDGVMEAIGIGGPEHVGTRLTVLRAIDKMDKFPVEEIRKLLGPGRLDESGDFTKGAGLETDQIEKLFATLEADFDAEILPNEKFQFDWTVEGMSDSMISLRSYTPAIFLSDAHSDNDPITTASFRQGMLELLRIQRLVRASGYGPDRIRIDPSVIRGLEYYTGPVYEVELTFEVSGDDGKAVRFGSVGGGGRYDGLVGRFRAEDVPATGISIGVSRLQAALTHLGKLKTEKPVGPVVVTVMDKTSIGEYQKMTTELRNAGIRAELYLGDGAGFGAQMKYCNRRNSPLAIIQGTDEAAKGEVQIKDLVKGAALAEVAKTITDREEYLARQAEVQYAVKRGDLVEAVKKALGI